MRISRVGVLQKSILLHEANLRGVERVSTDEFILIAADDLEAFFHSRREATRAVPLPHGLLVEMQRCEGPEFTQPWTLHWSLLLRYLQRSRGRTPRWHGASHSRACRRRRRRWRCARSARTLQGYLGQHGSNIVPSCRLLWRIWHRIKRAVWHIKQALQHSEQQEYHLLDGDLVIIRTHLCGLEQERDERSTKASLTQLQRLDKALVMLVEQQLNVYAVENQSEFTLQHSILNWYALRIVAQEEIEQPDKHGQ
mmetsp:Transcript_34627/g.64118  ORF Transcript_34627/g.64118 Transcript_34627/m.64118 type:complete len:253 (+) Transcript_34627:805-1563(+)